MSFPDDAWNGSGQRLLPGDRFEYTQIVKDGDDITTRYLVESAIWSRGVLVRYELIDQSGETIERPSEVLHQMLNAGRLKFF